MERCGYEGVQGDNGGVRKETNWDQIEAAGTSVPADCVYDGHLPKLFQRTFHSKKDG